MWVNPKGQIKTITYPPLSTSKHQPQNMGIIAATKHHFRRTLLRIRVATMSETNTLRAQAKEPKMVAGTMGLAEGHQAHLLDAAELLHAAWIDVTPPTIARCAVQ